MLEIMTLFLVEISAVHIYQLRDDHGDRGNQHGSFRWTISCGGDHLQGDGQHHDDDDPDGRCHVVPCCTDEGRKPSRISQCFPWLPILCRRWVHALDHGHSSISFIIMDKGVPFWVAFRTISSQPCFRMGSTVALFLM